MLCWLATEARIVNLTTRPSIIILKHPRIRSEDGLFRIKLVMIYLWIHSFTFFIFQNETIFTYLCIYNILLSCISSDYFRETLIPSRRRRRYTLFSTFCSHHFSLCKSAFWANFLLASWIRGNAILWIFVSFKWSIGIIIITDHHVKCFRWSFLYFILITWKTDRTMIMVILFKDIQSLTTTRVIKKLWPYMHNLITL